MYIFVVASRLNADGSPVLLQDFRPDAEQDMVPDDMSKSELAQNFSQQTAAAIDTLSQWILCAPYLSGSLPNALPGWIPVFNSRPDVHIRAYISTFNGCNSRLLHMDRLLIQRVFGFDNSKDLLSNVSQLVTPCMVLDSN